MSERNTNKAVILFKEIMSLNDQIYNNDSTITGLHIRTNIKKRSLIKERDHLIRDLINIYPIDKDKKHLLKDYKTEDIDEDYTWHDIEMTPQAAQIEKIKDHLEELTYPIIPIVTEVSRHGRFNENDITSRIARYLPSTFSSSRRLGNMGSLVSGVKKTSRKSNKRRKRQTRRRRKSQTRRRRKSQTRRRRKRKTT